MRILLVEIVQAQEFRFKLFSISCFNSLIFFLLNPLLRLAGRHPVGDGGPKAESWVNKLLGWFLREEMESQTW